MSAAKTVNHRSQGRAVDKDQGHPVYYKKLKRLFTAFEERKESKRLLLRVWYECVK